MEKSDAESCVQEPGEEACKPAEMNRLLRMAVVAGSNKAISLHLEKKPDLNAVDEKGMSLLMLAASRGHSDTCRILLEAGADPNFESPSGQTAINVARGKGHHDTASTIYRYLNDARRKQAETHASAVSSAGGEYLDNWDEEVEDEVPEPRAVLLKNDSVANLENVPLSCLITSPLHPLSLGSDIFGSGKATARKIESPSVADAAPGEPDHRYGHSGSESFDEWDEDPEPEMPAGDY